MSTGRAPTSHQVRLDSDQRYMASLIAQARGITQAEGEREYVRQMMEYKRQLASGEYSQQWPPH